MERQYPGLTGHMNLQNFKGVSSHFVEGQNALGKGDTVADALGGPEDTGSKFLAPCR